MKYLRHDLDSELILMRDYKLNPTELFTIKVILLAQDGDYTYLQQFSEILNGQLRLVLESRYNFFTKESNPLNLYLHKNVYNDIKNFYPSIDYFVYEEKCANLIFFEDNENVKI